MLTISNWFKQVMISIERRIFFRFLFSMNQPFHRYKTANFVHIYQTFPKLFERSLSRAFTMVQKHFAALCKFLCMYPFMFYLTWFSLRIIPKVCNRLYWIRCVNHILCFNVNLFYMLYNYAYIYIGNGVPRGRAMHHFFSIPIFTQALLRQHA